jgi:hypothetical protein
VLELPELEQRLSNLQSQVERLWRKAEASVPPIEQRLASMADQYAEYLKRWAVTVERHAQAVTQLEAYALEWKDASSQMRQETAERLHDLETTIESEWDTLKKLQEEPIRELREQAESLTQVSRAMATASQQGLDRAEARFVSFENEVHLRLNELTMELQSALAEMKARLDRHPASRETSSQWSLDEVTRLHGQLRDGARGTAEVPRTIDHPTTLPARQVLSARPETTDGERRAQRAKHASRLESLAAGIPVKWAAAVVVLAIGVLLAGVFGWRMQSQIKDAAERQRIADSRYEQARNDAARQGEEVRRAAAEEVEKAREVASRTQRIADVLTAPDLIRFNLSGAAGASGQVLFSRSRGVVVSGSRLPPPAPNSSHLVWLLTPAEAVKMGPLSAEPDGTVTLVQAVPSIPRRVVGVMVTEEPSASGDVPSGTAVLSSVVRAAQP